MKFIEKLKKDKEFRDYLIWGVISSCLNIGLFRVLICLGLDYKTSNIITLVFVRIFCYVTNKLFVFHSKCKNRFILLKEMISFFSARFLTLLTDYFIVFLLVEMFGMNSTVSKILSTVLVIFINYIFSKLFVFRKTGTMNNGKGKKTNEADHSDSMLQ